MLKYILLSLLLVINVHARDNVQLPGIAKEIKCLADNIYFEARNESTQGQLAVALVTNNRVNSKHYPDTICEVVWEYKQFSWTIDGLSDIPKNKDAYNKAKFIALLLVTSNITDFTEGATHYHATYVNPYWSSKLVKLTKIDNHIFYKFKK